MRTVTREQVHHRDDDVTLIEVLDRKHFEEFHLPGAINVPVSENFDERIQSTVPDKHSEVILYCYDADCDAAEKAARRMEALGYDNVYDYAPGKMDWKESGMPVEH